MTTTRTDVHRPISLVTEDYEYLYCFDNEQPGRLIGVDMAWWRSITNFDPAMEDRGTHQCHHCGARIRYVGLLRHVPSGYAIAVGETCMENRFDRATADFQRARKAAELDRKEQRIKTAAREAVAGIQRADVRDALDRDFDLTGLDLSAWAVRVVGDIRGRLWNYGTISPKQVDLIARCIDEVPARKAAEAARDAEVEIPAPTGRVAFTGTVVSTKWHDSDFGGSMKMTVKVTEPTGIWLVWVTVPSGLDVAVGDTVSLTATLTPSTDKAHFAFGKRPAKATVTPAAVVAA